jgi:EAL domain-containing protein (putative c-di-GMP-specific phosphodiesterase class I)/GGDEF domain-containing protein/CHASE3 domain sensor protein
MSVVTISEEIKAIAVYFLIILLGFVLSLVVYFAVTDVERTTKTLVERQIPTLTLIRQTMSNVTEQERVLYEYYATNESTLYSQHYAATKAKTENQINELALLIFNDNLISIIYAGLDDINHTADNFFNNIQSDATSWDLAREQLLLISLKRREIIQLLRSLQNSTQHNVTEGYNKTLRELNTTNTTVLIYSLSIIIIALVTGWYMRIYFKVSVRNKRLALFTQRNPHPIISINAQNEITYYNPATRKLLAINQDSELQISDLIPSLFVAMSTKQKKQNAYRCFEHTLADLTLRCEVHWLSELNLFDLHISDITAEKKAKEKLKFQAFHCPETALQNSYKLSQLLDKKVSAKTPFSLGLFEMRHYNRFVAGHGVESAQVLIKSIAARLYIIVSQSELDLTLFKLNEKTFSFIIDENVHQEKIEQFCQSIESTMKNTLTTDFGDFNVELDFGFCSFPAHGQSTDSLLQYARIALDEAIAQDHQSFSYFDQRLSEQLNNTLKLTNWLRTAIQNSELSLVYQPQMDIHENRLIGMETLIRWHHGEQFISPVEFIPIAEQTGLIIEIGQWLLIQACVMAKALIDEGHDTLVLAVNISPRQFRHPQFLSMIKEVLAQTGLAPEKLELEITEGVILYNESATISVLHQLKALGIQLSIDDFGTGYSSLSYLKQFPIDKLKIDQSFVKNLHANEEDKAIVQAIVDLGKNLGLKVIAEGVELQEHFDLLKALNCDEIQGYLYSKPLDKQTFRQFITDHQ